MLNGGLLSCFVTAFCCVKIISNVLHLWSSFLSSKTFVIIRRLLCVIVEKDSAPVDVKKSLLDVISHSILAMFGRRKKG